MTTTQVITQFYLNSGLNNNNNNNNNETSPKKCVLSKNALLTAKKELREDNFVREQALQQLRQRVERNTQLINCRTGIFKIVLILFLQGKKNYWGENWGYSQEKSLEA